METVSIIVPMYNIEKFIQYTIESVTAQTYRDWELLLVDDCGPDHTKDVVKAWMAEHKDPRVRLIEQEANCGAALSRNRGVQESVGRYVAFLDGDDLWKPEKLEHELDYMKKTNAGFVFSGYEFADCDGVGTGKVVRVPQTITYREALKNTTIFTSTVLFDTEKINRDEIRMPQIASEDTALWWNLLREGRTAYGLDENLVLYRRSGKTLSSNKLTAIKRIWGLYRKNEKMGIVKSAYHVCFWAVRAVKRRV